MGHEASDRFMLGSIGSNVLVRSLVDMHTSWDLNLAMEASLARIVVADEKDFNSRTKLKLLRIVRTLCGENSAAEFAVVLTGTHVVD